MGVRNERREKVTAEIDERIYSLIFQFLDGIEDLDTDYALAHIRAAYFAGYRDCMREPAIIRGKWFLDLGYGMDD